MALCRQYGISHSHFLGGKRKWTELDREKALAYEVLLLEQCPRCRTLREDWVDEKGRPLEQPLMAAVGRHCYGCEEVAKIEDKIPKSIKGAFPAIIPFAHLTDEDDEWYDPTKDPVEMERRQKDELERARSLDKP